MSQILVMEDASRAVGASVSSIAHQLPAELGKTFGQLRRETRVALAKRLLATSTMEISEIAGACGFADQSHLTRVLKAEISLTPGQFRKMLKEHGGKAERLKVESRESKVESREAKVESRESKVESRKSRVESREAKVEIGIGRGGGRKAKAEKLKG